jgi:hypothetical protein
MVNPKSIVTGLDFAITCKYFTRFVRDGKSHGSYAYGCDGAGFPRLLPNQRLYMAETEIGISSDAQTTRGFLHSCSCCSSK